MSAASASAAAPGYTVSSLPIVTGTTNPSQIPEAAFIDDIEAFIKANGTSVETLLQELQTLHQYVGIASRPCPTLATAACHAPLAESIGSCRKM